MATAREIITELAGHQRQLERRVKELEAQVAQLIKSDDLAWDSPLNVNLGGDGISAVGAGEHPASAVDAGSTPAASTRSIKITENGIDVPAPTDEQRYMRAQIVDHLGLEHLPANAGITAEQAQDAFLRGGPAWLYNWDNRYCYDLPYNVKQIMVADLDIDDHEYAVDVGRDLLKLRDDEKGARVDAAIEQDGKYRDHFGGTTGAPLVRG